MMGRGGPREVGRLVQPREKPTKDNRLPML
jgi:hypothetical protein